MLRSLWKLQWKQFAARMKKGNGKKTSGGWRISGGTYFETVYDITPPETGDNTPIFLTLTALSVLGFCALAVTVKRKEKLT